MADDAQSQLNPDGFIDTPKARLWREVLIIFGLVTLACALIYQFGRFIPVVGQHRSAGIAALFLYIPTWWIGRRGERYEAYALTSRPRKLGLKLFFVVTLLVFPPFILLFHYWYKFSCRPSVYRYMPRPYRLLCRRFQGSFSFGRLTWGLKSIEQILGQLIAIALPEEYFFRGYIQTTLERVMPPQRKWLGGNIGAALLLSSLLFALGHVLVDFNPLRMAVFLPSLAFGWMRSKSGSILAPVLFHACCNLLSAYLHRGYFA